VLVELSDEEFKNYVGSIVAELLEKDKTLTQESNRYWREITNESYVFDRGIS
jgi:nardilysin